jgi:DNA-binding Lrp family transcriptional regulator
LAEFSHNGCHCSGVKVKCSTISPPGLIQFWRTSNNPLDNTSYNYLLFRKKMFAKDSLDEQLIKLLSQDTRQSSQKLAKQLHVSASTVRNRLRRLIRNENLHFIVAIDPFKVGLQVVVQILLDVEQDKIAQTLESLVILPEVSYVSAVSGRFNIIMYACFPSHLALASFMQNQLGKIAGVRDCETLICLEIKKGRFIPIH